MGEHEEFFKFAAKAGSLEGYIFERETLEPLSNWVENIDSMYRKLPEDVKKDVAKAYRTVLTRVLQYGEGVLEREIKQRLERMVSELE
ncbi:MAG: hypothetical protein ACE5IA_01745 [Dehalococcoidia bacterium]